jgi:hypothetical protein
MAASLYSPKVNKKFINKYVNYFSEPFLGFKLGSGFVKYLFFLLPALTFFWFIKIYPVRKYFILLYDRSISDKIMEEVF